MAGKKISPEKKKAMIDELDKKKADLEEEKGKEDEQKRKKQKQHSSWKSWGTPAISKAVAAATMFAEVEGHQDDQQLATIYTVNDEIFGWDLCVW